MPYAIHGPMDAGTGMSAWGGFLTSGPVPNLPGWSVAPPWVQEPETQRRAPTPSLDSLPSLDEAETTGVRTPVQEAPVPEEPATVEVPVHYEGDNDTCTICISPFADGERVARLQCRHVFHAECLDQLLEHARHTNPFATAEPPCVTCRGGGRIVATWRWIVEPPEPRPATVPIYIPPPTPGGAEFHTPGGIPSDPAFAAPWWPEPAASTSLTYHASTGLGPNRIGFLVDPGS